MNGLVVGASGGVFVAMQGEPRIVGTHTHTHTLLRFVCRQLVLFIGPTGYHRSPAQTDCVRDKEGV